MTQQPSSDEEMKPDDVTFIELMLLFILLGIAGVAWLVAEACDKLRDILKTMKK